MSLKDDLKEDKLFENSQSTDVKFFFDAANLWGADFKDNDNASSYIRSSAGLALDWFTPVGPLNFSLAKPITKKSSDITTSEKLNQSIIADLACYKNTH